MGTKTRPLYKLSTQDPPQNKGHIQTEVKGWKKVFHANGDQKKAGVAILISDKIDFEIKAVKRDKEGRTLHNDQRINPRRYNNYKYICTQHRSTTIWKANANKHEREN